MKELIESMLLNKEAKQLRERICDELRATYSAYHPEDLRLLVKGYLGGFEEMIYEKFHLAINAVSQLISEHVDLVRPTTKVIHYNDSGAVSMDGTLAIRPRALRLEIARFANLWEPTSKQPAAVIELLAKWEFLALSTQPRLLRRFRVLYVGEATIGLVLVEPGDEAPRWIVVPG